MTARAPLAASLVLALFALSACRGDEPPAPATPPTPSATEADADTAALDRAQAALGPLKQGLRGALEGAMKRGSVADAVSACKLEAPAVAEAASAKAAVLVGRVSDRLRNPDNTGRPWVAPLLAEYAATPRAEQPAHRLVALEGGGHGYVEPIYTAGLCLSCHGATLPPEVEAILASEYPADRARGYAEGDLRGLFWVELR